MPLDLSENSWNSFLQIVNIAKENQDVFESPVQKREYLIKEILDSGTIIIKRTSGEESRFNKKAYFSFLQKINNSNGILTELGRPGHRTKISTIVNIHPQHYWSDNGKQIHVIDASELVTTTPNYNIPDDDPYARRNASLRIRKGQPKFRRSLMKECKSKCCITGTNVTHVLDACHIEEHAQNGINHISNGILLRADIHDLFDYNLLFIEPTTHIVHIHKDLLSSKYGIYHGTRINIKHVDNKYLVDRWKEKNW